MRKRFGRAARSGTGTVRGVSHSHQRSIPLFVAAFLASVACSSNEASEPEPPPPPPSDDPNLGLHQRLADHFAMGAAVDAQSYTTHAALLTTHFNSITTENEMKFDALHPSEDTFQYDTADAMVAFAQQNSMAVRGHALIWHRQVPVWVFQGSDGQSVTPEVLLARMERHITEVMTHFRGRVGVWDVVNEAIMNDGGYRTGGEAEPDQQSQWYAVLGERYVADAFRFAHNADPDAKLFYNDYYDYLPAKHQAIHGMLKGLLDQGVPVHGVGMQCHLNIAPSTDSAHQSSYQTIENLEAAIELYASLGLEVHVTEMDVSLYIGGQTYDESNFYTLETFTEAVQEQQAQRYRAFFELFRKHSDVIKSVTFWGIADDNTWLSEFDSGRQDFPLLFDVNHQPKKAYYSVRLF